MWVSFLVKKKHSKKKSVHLSVITSVHQLARSSNGGSRTFSTNTSSNPTWIWSKSSCTTSFRCINRIRSFHSSACAGPQNLFLGTPSFLYLDTLLRPPRFCGALAFGARANLRRHFFSFQSSVYLSPWTLIGRPLSGLLIQPARKGILGIQKQKFIDRL